MYVIDVWLIEVFDIVYDHKLFAENRSYHKSGGVLVQRNDIVNDERLIVLFQVKYSAALVEDIERCELGAYDFRNMVYADLADRSDLHAVKLFNDRGYVIENGMLTLSGTGGELMDNPEVKAAYFGV